MSGRHRAVWSRPDGDGSGRDPAPSASQADRAGGSALAGQSSHLSRVWHGPDGPDAPTAAAVAWGGELAARLTELLPRLGRAEMAAVAGALLDWVVETERRAEWDPLWSHVMVVAALESAVAQLARAPR